MSNGVPFFMSRARGALVEGVTGVVGVKGRSYKLRTFHVEMLGDCEDSGFIV